MSANHGGGIMIKPLYDRVLLKKIEVKTQTESGILLPDSNETIPSMARVEAVGEGRLTEEGKTIPVDVKIGDVVVYKEYSTTEIKYKNEDYLIIDMNDILAIVEEE